MTTTDTPQAPSADTLEIVAALPPLDDDVYYVFKVMAELGMPANKPLYQALRSVENWSAQRQQRLAAARATQAEAALAAERATVQAIRDAAERLVAAMAAAENPLPDAGNPIWAVYPKEGRNIKAALDGLRAALSTPPTEQPAPSDTLSLARDLAEGLVEARDWLKGWASAERELSVIDPLIERARAAGLLTEGEGRDNG